VEGKMRINGREITEPGADRMMIFQEFDQLLPWKTVLENVMFPLLMTRRLPRRQAEARARAYIEKVSLTPRRRQLSAYVVRRHEAARRHRPRHGNGARHPADGRAVRGFDALTRRTCQDELLQLGKKPKFTVLFVTHSIAEAIKIGTAFCCCRRIPAGSRPRSSTSIRCHRKTAAPAAGTADP